MKGKVFLYYIFLLIFKNNILIIKQLTTVCRPTCILLCMRHP